MLFALLLTFVEVMACPARVVLHVAAGAVHSLVLLVNVWNSFLDPPHIFCCFICCSFAEVLVDGALALVSLWEEELWISLGITKVSPSQSCLFGIGHALLDCDLLLLAGLSRRSTVFSLRTSCSPFSLSLLGGVLPLPSIASPWRLVPRLEDFDVLLPKWVLLQTYHFYHGLGLVEGIDKFFCISLSLRLSGQILWWHAFFGLREADSVRKVDGRDCRKVWSF